MIEITIAAADIGALSDLLTTDPSAATEGLVQLCIDPPKADSGTLRRLTEILLNAGANPNHHETLYHACEHANHAILEALLASPKLEPPWLSYCLLHKLDQDDLDGVRKMLQRGADPNLRSRQGDREMSLHHAIRRGRDTAALDLLLSFGARADIINIHNHTARRQAIRFGRTELGFAAPEATALDHWLFRLWHGPASVPPPEALGKQEMRLLDEAARMGRHDAVQNMLGAGFTQAPCEPLPPGPPLTAD
ncbi:MAG: hypothetical protein HYX27_21675 [Acidobacteria bacterium]|nr:hypothetical protein [Acidobacteriota bacterium]